MSLYKHLREIWKKPKSSMPEEFREKLLSFRKEPATIKIAKPTRLDRARSLGYKAKQGMVVVRQRISKGGRKRSSDRGGRRSKHNRLVKIVDVSHKREAEQRVSKKYKNCEVLNSYFVLEDGHHMWFEVILLDRAHPQITSNPKYANVAKHKGRVHRGLTSTGKKARGLMKKGKGTAKMRPSKTQNLKTRKKI